MNIAGLIPGFFMFVNLSVILRFINLLSGIFKPNRYHYMRIVLFVLLACYSIRVTAQELDFRDYRTKKESFTKIPEKDVRADVASFAVGGIDESIGKLPLTKIGVSKYESSFMSFERDNIKVVITTGR